MSDPSGQVRERIPARPATLPGLGAAGDVGGCNEPNRLAGECVDACLRATRRQERSQVRRPSVSIHGPNSPGYQVPSTKVLVRVGRQVFSDHA
jgi:hypothetical protein